VNWDGLVEALVAVAPHILGEECPICGRDFSEVSAEPLRDHTARMISQYSEAAARVQVVAEARSSTQAKVSDITAAHTATAQQIWALSVRADVGAHALAVTDLRARLTSLEADAAVGSTLIRAARAIAAQVRELGSRQAAEQEVMSQISDEWILVYGADTTVGDWSVDSLTLLQRTVGERVGQLAAHVGTRSELRGTLDALRRLFVEQGDAEAGLERDRSLLTSGRATLAEARTRMLRAREIAAGAAQARAAIVATVFNGSLNQTWHDLFIRLAPDEPYVPSFGVPTTDRRLTEVELETVHRVGGHGGTPGAMLSAGNLNTAALTLFLALNLSVEPKVECIVLDDPVQSMDEMHVSQFAALLRTLSRQLGRQVVLAVHERSLFEYLRLELSPSEAGAGLITVELERQDGADTECRSSVVPWAQELSIHSFADAG
jgi:exonuclease SbcC